jgi:hypothetical protein
MGTGERLSGHLASSVRKAVSMPLVHNRGKAFPNESKSKKPPCCLDPWKGRRNQGSYLNRGNITQKNTLHWNGLDHEQRRGRRSHSPTDAEPLRRSPLAVVAAQQARPAAAVVASNWEGNFGRAGIKAAGPNPGRAQGEAGGHNSVSATRMSELLMCQM